MNWERQKEVELERNSLYFGLSWAKVSEVNALLLFYNFALFMVLNCMINLENEKRLILSSCNQFWAQVIRGSVSRARDSSLSD